MQEVRREVRNFVGGRWEERDGQATEPVYDPATGRIIAETPLSTYEDVDRAVKAAEAAFPGVVEDACGEAHPGALPLQDAPG